MPATHVALLRGINVGGKNKLLMKDLNAIFVHCGCENVSTFIQSGNVLFSSKKRVPALLPARIAEEIAARFGLRTPVVLRTFEEIRDVAAHNPFLQEGAPEDSLYVMFLSGQPDPAAIAALDPQRSPPDRFLVRQQDIYLFLARGVPATKLTNAYFDSKLDVISTARNWRTVIKLRDLMA